MTHALIGVSGWQYPEFSERFYPEHLEKTEQLTYYADQFPTVEINSTFYHLPKEQTVKNWQGKVPENFIFSVKASRYITHMKNLLDPEETLTKFYDRIKYLGDKCGPILFQLPPNWEVDIARLKSFLQELPKDHRHTIEFRNRTWLKESVYQLLRDHKIALCIYDFNYHQSPILTTSDFIYIRLHGPGRAYHDPYDLDSLEIWADRIKGWVDSQLDVYCYFDNTHRGYAWDNAKTVLSLLEG
jgi:uncharacterized protein YecE (DUF72 family)